MTASIAVLRVSGRITRPTTAERPGQGGTGRIPNQLLIVHDPVEGDLPVRWRVPTKSGTWIWNCRTCGHQTTTQCPHAWSAAMYLAERLLGLTPKSPTEGEHP